MLLPCLVVMWVIAQGGAQDDDGPYRGKLIGKLNSYHHQVSGEVYAVDEWTLLLVNFNYDGAGEDTFFWAGDAARPGPQGFIVPDEHGKTNILERYYGADVRLRLPAGKRVSRLRWLAVYDIASQNSFADVFVPEELEPPAPRTIAPLAGSPAVSSQPLRVLDHVTILIPELKYDGSGEEAYFWVGESAQPSARGDKVPDEFGYLEPLGTYNGTDVRLVMPGGRSVQTVRWIAVWDVARRQALGSALLPDELNVPPAETVTLPRKSSLPHCVQLHRALQLSWEVFGSAITLQLTGQIGEHEYMAFGISGSETEARMVGADVGVAAWDARRGQASAADYNVTAHAPCVRVLGAWQGVCPDELVGGQDNNQVLSAAREDGVTTVTYRRALMPVEAMDREWSTSRLQSVVWAVGALDAVGAVGAVGAGAGAGARPGMHRLYPRRPLRLNLTRAPPYSDCQDTVLVPEPQPAAWERAQLFDPALRVFSVALGPAGGARGLRGRHPHLHPAPPRALYVNGQLAPDLQLRRHLTYTFRVVAGNDPHSAELYHPLVITAEPRGGLDSWPPHEPPPRVLAGVHRTRRGLLAPTAAGPLCEGVARWDLRRADEFATFRAFNRSLQWRCSAAGTAPAPPAELLVAPNASWPDLVYYHSFTQPGMGGRIFVVDRHKRALGRGGAGVGSGAAAAPSAAPLAPPLVAVWAARLLAAYTL